MDGKLLRGKIRSRRFWLNLLDRIFAEDRLAKIGNRHLIRLSKVGIFTKLTVGLL